MLHWRRRSLSVPLKANVLQKYLLFKAIGLVRLLNVHSRGIHPLKGSLAVGVRQFDNDKVCNPIRVPKSARELLRNERHGTGSRLEAVCKGEGSSNFPLCTSMSKSSASHVTLSWTRQLRIKKSILTQTE